MLGFDGGATTDGESPGRGLVGVVGAFAVIAALAAWDLSADLGEGTTLGHVVAEGVVLLLAALGAVWGAQRLRALSRDNRRLDAEAAVLEDRLDAARQQAVEWRATARNHARGLGAAIDAQLEAWQLTPAEKDVARLLLKGLSHKEIGHVRQVSEATVRQQARAVYRKSELEGRHELAAFFLEDLLAPPDDAGH